ncbi:MAG: SPASM domain-containing protein [Bacteroidales bacterium]|nr:SPASM domain-containing protein [Bacteroidales bacterium]
MKPSKFNIYIKRPDNETLIFNSFSDSRVIVDEELLNIIKNCEQLTDKSRMSQLLELKELGILTESKMNEDKEIEYWFQKMKFDSSILSATILTTFACNMKCIYCFEQGVDSNISMKQEIINNTCAWLTNRMEQLRPKELVIIFFGGEPLMNLKAVEYISKTLFLESQKQGVKLSIEIITNGILLTPKLIDFLLPFGLRKVKVTLDGDQKTHDRMRPLKVAKYKDKGTYNRILENLLKIKGKVPIFIGGNYDNISKSHIPVLLDDLKEMGFKDEIKEIAFKPILGFPNHEKNSIHKIDACTFSETNVDDLYWLVQETEKRGFKPMKKIALGPCEAVRENSFTIDPSGKIYKCSAMVGREEYSVGNVNKDWENSSFNSVNVSFMTSDAWKNCLNCKFLPLCGGGCRLGALMQKGNLDDISCEKEYFEKVLNKLIISEI